MTSPSFDSQSFVKNLTTLPGVYKFFDKKNSVIYVGKAKNLKKRVSSYFRASHTNSKTVALVQQITHIEVIVTNSEKEALLLENNLIKSLKPKYNVLFKDDKSYPYIYVSTHETFPQFSYHRGSKKRKGTFYGPYPNVGAVRYTLKLLQKMFKVRQCDDSFFKSRTRACLQYQINRCSAPCVKHISSERYAASVDDALLFLSGKSDQLITELTKKMEQASIELNYEDASHYRDQVAQLRLIREKQYIEGKRVDIDVIAVANDDNIACIQMLIIRDGRLLGDKQFLPQVPNHSSPEDILEAFLSQHYLQTKNKDIPANILLSHSINNKNLYKQLLGDAAQRSIRIHTKVRTQKAKWLELARTNAENAIRVKNVKNHLALERLSALQKALDLPDPPIHMECFDISHTAGNFTVASCVVFKHGKPETSMYRLFKIDGVQKSDDYAAMKQVLTRRYTKLKEKEQYIPDLIVIDGGKGQLTQAENVFKDLQMTGVQVIGVAKGPTRKAGYETLHLSDLNLRTEFKLEGEALHLLQHIRDESHRFAVTGHRKQRKKAQTASPLEKIDGIGPKRRKALLTYFGGIKQLQTASQEEIANVPGISQLLAEQIYTQLHGY